MSVSAFSRALEVYYDVGTIYHDNIKDWQDFEEAYCTMGHSRPGFKLVEFSYHEHPTISGKNLIKVRFDDGSLVTFVIVLGLTQDKDEFSVMTMNQLLLPSASEELISLRKRFMKLVHLHNISFFRRVDKYI